MVEERRHGRRSGRTVIVVVVGGGWRVSLWWCKHPCGLKVFPKSDVPKKVLFPKSVVPKFPKVKWRLKHRRIAHTQQWPRENRGTTGATQKTKIKKTKSETTKSSHMRHPYTCDTIHMRHHTHATPISYLLRRCRFQRNLRPGLPGNGGPPLPFRRNKCRWAGQSAGWWRWWKQHHSCGWWWHQWHQWYQWWWWCGIEWAQNCGCCRHSHSHPRCGVVLSTVGRLCCAVWWVPTSSAATGQKGRVVWHCSGRNRHSQTTAPPSNLHPVVHPGVPHPSGSPYPPCTPTSVAGFATWRCGTTLVECCSPHCPTVFFPSPFPPRCNPNSTRRLSCRPLQDLWLDRLGP